MSQRRDCSSTAELYRQAGSWHIGYLEEGVIGSHLSSETFLILGAVVSKHWFRVLIFNTKLGLENHTKP